MARRYLTTREAARARRLGVETRVGVGQRTGWEAKPGVAKNCYGEEEASGRTACMRERSVLIRSSAAALTSSSCRTERSWCSAAVTRRQPTGWASPCSSVSCGSWEKEEVRGSRRQ